MLRDHGLDPGTGNEPGASVTDQVGPEGTEAKGNAGGRGDEARGEKEAGVGKNTLPGPCDPRDWSQSHLVSL